MLHCQKITKNFGSKEILKNISFTLNAGEHAALLGPNGCGKTTLLRIIAGELPADSGSAAIANGAVLGYLPQGYVLGLELTLGEAVFAGVADYLEARREVERILAEMEIVSPDGMGGHLAEYDAALARFEGLGGYALEERGKGILSNLGLNVDLTTPLGELSGGERTRAGLARTLLAEPDILLLDEPTNHLDMAALEWLEETLSRYRGAILVVSHDRAFLNKTANKIIAINDETHESSIYSGGYDDYVHAKETQLEKQWAKWGDQVAEERRMKIAINRIQQHSTKYENISKHDFQRRKAKVLMQKAMAQRTRLERDLVSADRVEKPKAGWTMDLDFGETPRGGENVVRLAGVGHRYNSDPFLFRDVSLTLRHGERIALLGANGSGKTTLFRIIMNELVPTEGEVITGPSTRIGYMPQGQAGLPLETTPLDLIRSAAALSETDARRFLHKYLFSGDEVFTRIDQLSYGQRARLLLAGVVLGGANCLILDEPVNHLDIPSRENFTEALSAFPGPVLFTAHDRALIDEFATGVWVIRNGGIQAFVDREDMRRER